MGTTQARLVAAATALLLVAGACTESDDGADEATGGGDPATTVAGGPTDDDDDEAIDHEALGLWDDGPCDAALEPLHIGLMTVFESPLVSLEDQALALEASATAFNARGGANGTCIEVTTCDDGTDPNQALDCVRTLDDAGVVVTVNDQGTTAQGDVSAAMAAAGIPRLASNVANDDRADQNAYPLDPSGTGGTFMHPGALVAAGVTEIGLIRVDLAQASALLGLIEGIYADDGVTFPYDVPVPGGTTDYSQFVIGAEEAGVGGVTLNLGEQEAIQVVRAAQQLGSSLQIGAGLGTFSQSSIAELGDFAEQMVFDNPFPPATFDLPVYEVLRADLAASGEEELQPENMRTSPMRSWIGIYALIKMLRDAPETPLTREGISTLLQTATDVPMLGIFGDEAWTPDRDHPGLFQRAGIGRYVVYRFDPEAPAPDGVEGGNFVEIGTLDYDETLCGSPIGAPAPCE